MRRSILIVVMLVSTSCSATLHMTCVFDVFTAVYSGVDRAPETTLIAKTMTIKDFKTVEETLSLDGQMRATNSKEWKYLPNNFMNLSKSHFAGDAGELLTIFHEVGEKVDSLNGTYKSSLIDSGYYQSAVRYGKCMVN